MQDRGGGITTHSFPAATGLFALRLRRGTSFGLEEEEDYILGSRYSPTIVRVSVSALRESYGYGYPQRFESSPRA